MSRKITVFSLGEEDFGFDIMRVIEIIRLKEITEVPTAPVFIEGVINLRGKIIPVVDLRKRFKLVSKVRDKKNRIIIIEMKKQQLVGVIVDNVAHVMNVNEEDEMPAPSMVTGVGGGFIESLVKLEDRIIILLDIERIFSDEEQNGILDAIKAADEIKDGGSK